MLKARRLIVATFSALLLAGWTVPVCCLSMISANSANSATNDVADDSAMDMPSMNMAGHAHHHAVSSADPASKRMTAAECAQGCQTADRMVAVSSPAREGLSAFQCPLAILTVAIRPVEPSLPAPNQGPVSPPGIARSARAVPLRV